MGRAIVALGVSLLCVLSTLSESRAESPPNVAPNASFELDRRRLGGWLPIGPIVAGTAHGVEIVDDVARGGKRSLRVTPGPHGPVRGTVFFSDYNGGEGQRTVTVDGGVRGARTIAMRLDPDTEALAAGVWVRPPRGASVTLTIVWTGRRDRRPVVELRRDRAHLPRRTVGDWALFDLQAERPAGSLQASLWIESDAVAPFWIDDVSLRFRRRPSRVLLVDQLGYETRSTTKRVVLQSTRPIESPPAPVVVDVESGAIVFAGAWEPRGYQAQWDLHHWTAEFSALERPGRYVVMVGGKSPVRSPPFEIADDLVRARTSEVAYRFYTLQRCGVEVPGFHAACHLDDARLAGGEWRDLAGGWHDAGDYNKYCGLTPEAMYALALAYHFAPDAFRDGDRDGSGLADILDEALWGARFVRKMLDEERLELLDAVFSGYRYWGPPERETDNRPKSGDERPVRAGRGDPTWCAPGFALLGKHVAASDDEKLAQRGRDLIAIAERLAAKYGGGVETQAALFAATGASLYRDAARARATELAARGEGLRELGWYAMYFPDDPLTASASIGSLARSRVDALRGLCDDRFGVARRSGPGGTTVYCRAYEDVNDWYVGETRYRLDVAIEGLLAARLGAAGGRAVAEDQVHWILGRNPLGVSLMEGVGKHFVPGYHHRYNAIPGHPRGAVPGAILNGFVRAWPHVDRPWLDMSDEPNADYHTNEPWLLQNNRWLVLLALWGR